MNRRHGVVTVLLLAAVLSALIAPWAGSARAQEPPPARLRVLHAVPGAPNVDVYLDGTRVAADLPFGGVTPHLTLDGQQYLVTLRQAGTSPDGPALIDVPVPLVPSLAFTVVAQGDPTSVQAALYEDILDEINPGMARLTAINAIADAPPIDVLTTEGGPLLQGVNYGSQFGTVNINTGVQNLVMVPAGGAVESALATIGEVPLRSGVLYTFVTLGTIDGAVAPAALVLATPVNQPENGAVLQIAHGSPDAVAVDVYADDVLVAPALTLGELTGHLPLDAGEYTLALRPAGAPAADEPLQTQDVVLDAGSAVTVVARGTAADGALALDVVEDAFAAVTPQMARIAVVNAVADATVSVSISDEAATLLASNLSAAADTAAVDVAPGTYLLTVNVAGLEEPLDLVLPESTYLGGVYYTVLIYGGGAVPVDGAVAATPLVVTPESLPADQVAVAAVIEQPTEQPTDAPTDQPVEEAPEVVVETPLAESEVVAEPPADAPPASEETELVQTTPVPESEVVAEPLAPTPAPLVALQAAPSAFVDLNPGANLHCREYPGSTSLSLGLIASGSTVTVLGRPGEPALPETEEEAPLEETPAVEGVEDMWLTVRWEPTGGGYVTCWVSAQYLRVEWQGRILDTVDELNELPAIPPDTPGEIVGAAVSQPTPIFDGILATVELQPGVSLQLRRQPNTSGESLDLVPAGAQLEILGYAEAPSEGLVGQPTDPNWYFVRYRTENGGATIGWVSAQYVSTPTRLGRVVSLAELSVIDVNELGYYEQPGQAPVVPTETQNVMGTVNLDPGANLNLRDQPSQDGRVVLGIPTGGSMVITGRNTDGSWVRVIYSAAAGNLEGWVASQFLVITRAGQPFSVLELPDLTGDFGGFDEPGVPDEGEGEVEGEAGETTG